MILMLYYYAVLNLLKGQGFGSLRDIKSEVCATRIYKVMHLSCQSHTKDLSTNKCTVYAAKKCTNRSFLLSSFTNEGQLISETILMKPSLNAAPPFPRTRPHGLLKDWDEKCQQNKEMLQNLWQFGISYGLHNPFSPDYES